MRRWFWEKDEDGSYSVLELLRPVNDIQDDVDICSTVFNESDANLISAAPEMLDALEEVHKLMMTQGGFGKLSDKVHNAIKKARGE